MIFRENLDPLAFAKWSRAWARDGNFARSTLSGVPASAARETPRPLLSTVGMRAEGEAPEGRDCGRTDIILSEKIDLEAAGVEGVERRRERRKLK